MKIRGNRVEPGEVEAALRRHPRVTRCAVAPRPDSGGENRLVAWVVGSAAAAELREHLRRTLPEYMVPAAFVSMDALPLSPNGKVDRRALPDPAGAAPEREYEAPGGPVEAVLAGMWVQVFDEHRLSASYAPAVRRVSAHDDFFALGGDSVLATRLIAHVQDSFGVELGFRAVLDHPTLRDMAAEIERLLYDDILTMSDEQAEAEYGSTPDSREAERTSALPHFRTAVGGGSR